MDRCTSLLKALDILTLLAARDTGLTTAEIVAAMHLPRSTVVRILNTLLEYGLVERQGRRLMCGSAFDHWNRRKSHHHQIGRYRPLLQDISKHTGELVLLGVQMGNGIAHIDYIESDKRIRVAPSPDTLHSMRHNALGKLALAKRPDLSDKWIKEDMKFSEELEEIRRTGVAWNREETIAGMVAVATYGFAKEPTEPMIAVAWPSFRFDEATATKVIDYVKTLVRDAT